MNRKTKVRAIAVLLAFILAAGVWATPSNETTATAAVSGEPEYGGTFTFVLRHEEPPSPAIADANFGSLYWLEMMQEHPIAGDFEKYGPRGSGAYMFQDFGYQPAQYVKGHLLESWEISYEKLVWRVRPGIMWAPTDDQMKRGVMKQPRELTAEDMAADVIRFMECGWRTRFEGIAGVNNVRVIDRYTLEIDFINFSPMLNYYLGLEDRSIYSPPETETAGADKWENQIGTGGFTFEEYVAGSHMSFVRNDNYWGTTVVDGKEYKIPFVDRIVCPIIPDPTTRMSALRTAQCDFAIPEMLSPEQFSVLDSVKDLQNVQLAGTSASVWTSFRCDEPPFDDVAVRRALMVGTNLDEFHKLAMAPDLPLLWNPVFPGNPAYVPLEKLPADIQVLYKYDPQLAKKMLADAGYPNGLDVKLCTETVERDRDRADLLKSQWSKIGVDLEIDARETTDYLAARYPTPKPTYHGVIEEGFTSANPLTVLDMVYKTRGGLNYAVYSNPKLDKLIADALWELDPGKQDQIIKEAAKVLLYDAVSIPLHFDRGKIYWWPWVKNYYGELKLADDCGQSQIFNYVWLDRDMKKKMGY
ncbi:MAG: ABC transporter substrate-binding protein [Spirochaetales bacterium]|nr:ABC transporter substrate-binding protein [Spirochaetales bacterium]